MLVWLGAGADYRTCFELEEEYQQKMQVVQAWIDDYQKRLQPVYDSIEAHLQDRMPDIETEYPLEEGKVSENTDVPWFDSAHNHYDQLVIFKQRQCKFVGDEIRAQEVEAAALQMEAATARDAQIGDLKQKIESMLGNGKLRKPETALIGALLREVQALLEQESKAAWTAYRSSLERFSGVYQVKINRWMGKARTQATSKSG